MYHFLSMFHVCVSSDYVHSLSNFICKCKCLSFTGSPNTTLVWSTHNSDLDILPILVYLISQYCFVPER